MTPIETFTFGTVDGAPVAGFTLRNRHGLVARLATSGARLLEMHVPDTQGRSDDVVLGLDSPQAYVAGETYMGATCGRYASRIRDSAFVLDGHRYPLSSNEGAHHAHGGREGFDRKLWSAQPDAGTNAVTFAHVAPDGDEGYPGELAATVTYRLTDDDVLAIDFRARTTRPTVVNLVHHSYWNLAGHASGNVLAHALAIDADFYLPIDAALVPTGEVLRVAGSPYDFRAGKRIGADIAAVPTASGGYDHHWCLRGPADALRRALTLADPGSGRAFELWTTAPGVQVYTGAHFSAPVTGKRGARYAQYAGVALETQRFPDAPNLPHFPACRLDPGEVYAHRMEFRFQTRGKEA